MLNVEIVSANWKPGTGAQRTRTEPKEIPERTSFQKSFVDTNKKSVVWSATATRQLQIEADIAYNIVLVRQQDRMLALFKNSNNGVMMPGNGIVNV